MGTSARVKIQIYLIVKCSAIYMPSLLTYLDTFSELKCCSSLRVSTLHRQMKRVGRPFTRAMFQELVVLFLCIRCGQVDQELMVELVDC